jgi:hypothetical protein
MKQLFFLSCYLFLFGELKAQDLSTYSTSTQEALIELRSILGENSMRFYEVTRSIAELEMEGGIVLSTKQYAEIQEKCDQLEKGEITDSKRYAELKSEVDALTSRFFVVTKVAKF